MIFRHIEFNVTHSVLINVEQSLQVAHFLFCIRERLKTIDAIYESRWYLPIFIQQYYLL